MDLPWIATGPLCRWWQPPSDYTLPRHSQVHGTLPQQCPVLGLDNNLLGQRQQSQLCSIGLCDSQPANSLYVRVSRDWIWARAGEIKVTVLFPPGSQLSPGMPPPGRLAEKLESRTGVEPPTVKALTADLNILDIMLAKQAGRPKLD